MAILHSSKFFDNQSSRLFVDYDYYPFGMRMPARKFTNGSEYRYGFNRKEKSNEIYGDGNVYDYGFRIYNPRLGKFLSTDPLIASYPWYTPYQFAGNTPIVAIDIDGLEEYVVTNYYDKNGTISKTVISTLTNKKNGKLVNMRLQKEDGTYVATQNVLVRNVSYDGTTTYTHQSSLNKQQKNIVEKAVKELFPSLEDSWAVGFGGGENGSDNGESIESEKKDFNNSYNLADFSSKKILKSNPQQPKMKKPETDTKPLPIKETSSFSFSSTINFWANTASTQYDGYKREVSDIVEAVQGKSDYSITIYGNFAVKGEKFSDEGNFIMKLNGYKTNGDLALARANKIKNLLVAKGLDPSKIKTSLGTEGKGMTADYKITTTTIK